MFVLIIQLKKHRVVDFLEIRAMYVNHAFCKRTISGAAGQGSFETASLFKEKQLVHATGHVDKTGTAVGNVVLSAGNSCPDVRCFHSWQF
jgi:hypothetical protein